MTATLRTRLHLQIAHGLLTVGSTLLFGALALLGVVIGALFSSDPLTAGAVFVFGAPFVLVIAGVGVGAIAWGWLFLDPSDRRFGTYLRAGGLGLIGVVLLSVMLEQWDWFVAIPVALLVIGVVGSLVYRATDAAGNAAIATCTVTVPHDRGR